MGLGVASSLLNMLGEPLRAVAVAVEAEAVLIVVVFTVVVVPPDEALIGEEAAWELLRKLREEGYCNLLEECVDKYEVLLLVGDLEAYIEAVGLRMPGLAVPVGRVEASPSVPIKF